MKHAAATLALGLAVLVRPAVAADCPTMDSSTLACQDAVAKAGSRYLRKHLGAVGRCLKGFHKGKIVGPDPITVCRGTSLSSPPTDPKTLTRLANAVSAGKKMISARCTDAQITTLSMCSTTVAGASCVFDEHFAAADRALGYAVGALVPTADKTLRRCQGRILSESMKFARARLTALQTCMTARQATCGTADPVVRCIGATDTGPAAEVTLLASVDAARDRLESRITAVCTDAQVAALDACDDTAADVAECLVCSHGNAADLALASEYRAVRAPAPGPTTLQAAADAADAGDTIVLSPGLYQTTQVTLKDSDLTLYGHKTCDGTAARALLEPPPSGPNRVNGIYSCGSLAAGCTDVADNVLFQGFEVNDYIDNDLYQVGLDGVTYRDMVTGGPGVAGGTEYGPFPVESNNVLIEDCVAHGLSDAAIYVGQSTNIVVRRNEVYDNVAGIEIENSANALVEDNYAHDNTAGILVFKLPGLPVQYSDCHVVRNNRSENNNGPNYGAGLVGSVPRGTGMFVISTDSTVVEGNTLTGNNTWGLAVVDQVVIEATLPGTFGSFSPDQDVNDNSIVGNTITGNGSSPAPGFEVFAADVLWLPSASSGNCQGSNTYATDFVGQFAALPACPGTPVQPGCPVVPTTTTTSTTTVTTTTGAPTTTTTLVLTWTQIYDDYIAGSVYPQCGSCHGASGPYTTWVGADKNATHTNIVNVIAPQHGTMDYVEPNDATMSYLMHKLDGTQVPAGGGGQQMPPGAPLSQAVRDAIRAWINSGAPNN
jgi:parallel beta-helix repeat protein